MTVAEQVTAEDDDADLTESLVALSTLSVARLSLEDLLTRVASFAVHAIPGADGAGLTLLEHDQPDTMVTSDEFARQVEKIQYGINEGPCITAAATGETVRSGFLSADPRWPRFGPRVGRLGVHSVLSLPLLTDEVVVGAMNVYAHTRDAFDDRAERIGQLFAVPATIAVQNAPMLAQTSG
jgi:transcriptional regulator with GAF, ATPase, and Fis domain